MAGPRRARARAGPPEARRLFRAVVLASAAVPGLFPPVRIPARDGQGRPIEEMHVDGGTMAPFYLAPAPMVLGAETGALPARRVTVVVNGRGAPAFEMVQSSLMSVLGRSMSAAIRAQTRAAITLARSFAGRTGLDLAVAEIGPDFAKQSPAPFDQDYMRALYAYGFETASGAEFGGRGPAAVAKAPLEPATTGSTRTQEARRVSLP